jgi:hypothetical protein
MALARFSFNKPPILGYDGRFVTYSFAKESKMTTTLRVELGDETVVTNTNTLHVTKMELWQEHGLQAKSVKAAPRWGPWSLMETWVDGQGRTVEVHRMTAEEEADLCWTCKRMKSTAVTSKKKKCLDCGQ